MSDIEDEARLIAVRWIEGYEPMGYDIEQKIKLASDLMNYAKRYHEQKNENIVDVLQDFIQDHYPTDVFPEITEDQLNQLKKFCNIQFGFPLDRFSAHISRILRKPLVEMATRVLKENK